MLRPLLMYLLVVTTPALALAVERSEMAVIDASRVALPVVQPLNGGHPPTALPSFPSSTYPYFATLKQYTFDNSGSPSAQGWTTHDRTVQDGVYWHVDDFAGLSAPLTAIAGTKSMWCGVRAGQVADPAYEIAPGYGNRWTQILKSPLLPMNGSPTAILSFVARYDFLDPNSDHLDVESRSGGGPWTKLATFSGSDLGGTMHQLNTFVFGSDVEFRFVVTTGVAGSDEDGWDTSGAAILDDIRIQNGLTMATVAFEDFEGYTPGATNTVHWSGQAASAFGNYGGLVNGTGVVQAGTPNTSHVWSFFNGSSETYACGGYPGQLAVPKTNSPGSTYSADYLINEVRSPYIDLGVDQNNQPVDPNFDAITSEFDVYLDNPSGPDVVMTFGHRFLVAGAPTPWNVRSGGFFTFSPRWVHITPANFGGVVIPPGATHIQIAILVVDRSYLTGATGACYSHAPLIDNVSVHRLFRPYFVTNTNDNGAGSLRQAIVFANGNANQNAILFAIPGDGPHIIYLDSPLPTIAYPVWIDGFSQAGAVPNQWPFLASTATMKIALYGIWAGNGVHGLDFAATSYSVVRGLVIGGFGGAGIRTASTSLMITGCYVGTDAAGTTAVPNNVGIELLSLQADIGGPANEDRMVIAGNTNDGIRVHAGSGPIFNSYVGVDAAGNAMWNGGAGIHVIGGSLCQIGQPTWAPCLGPYTDAMLVAYNAAGGIVVEPAASGVNIYQARMYGNGDQNIDLGADGPTANDPLDADTGANGLQNHPVLTSADGTTITGTMGGAPYELFRIEFFAGPDCDHTTQYLGYQEVTTDGSGNAVISFSCAQIPPATSLTATATNASYNTSEFSPCIVSTNTPPGSPLVNLYESNGPLRATVQFNAVGTAGNTFLAPTTSPGPLPSGWEVGPAPTYWDISTTAGHNGAQVTLVYDENTIPGPEGVLRLFHWSGQWEDITNTIDTTNNRIGGAVDSFSPFVLAVPVGATGADDIPAPSSFALHPNIPNPFNPATTISYDVPQGGAQVEISVFDVSGRLVRTLVSARRDAGSHRTLWNGDDEQGARVASGVYFYRMRAGTFVETRKMVLLK